MTPSKFTQWLASATRPTLVMGILNVTPDSFSDGGQHSDIDRAVAHADRMIAEGADLLDIGGESTRPGSERIDADEQIRRVVPVIEKLRRLDIAISVDTTLAAVASAALDAGAAIVNDISAGRDDAEMAPLVAARRCPVILMHMQGTPQTMQQNPTYTDVVAEVRAFLLERVRVFEAAGVNPRDILLDPGIGFGKNLAHNLALLKRLNELTCLPHPVLVGTSRKGFIGQVLDLPDPATRTFGTAATIAWAATNRAGIVRVHDVKPMKQIVKMIRAIAD